MVQAESLDHDSHERDENHERIGHRVAKDRAEVIRGFRFLYFRGPDRPLKLTLSGPSPYGLRNYSRQGYCRVT